MFANIMTKIWLRKNTSRHWKPFWPTAGWNEDSVAVALRIIDD